MVTTRTFGNAGLLPRACGVPERRGVGRGIGNVQLEPVDGHQPPAAQERPPGQHPGHRLRHPVEQQLQRLGPQPSDGPG